MRDQFALFIYYHETDIKIRSSVKIMTMYIGYRGIANKIMLYVVLCLISMVILFPIVWMLLSSFKTDAEALRSPITWFPHNPTVENYVKIWQIKPFLLFFLNSIIAAGGTASISTIIGSLAGYGFSRFMFFGRTFLIGLFLVTQMLPGVLFIGPYFKILSFTHLYNTRIGVIIAYVTLCLPFCAWMSKAFIDTIPKELDESAMIDGGSRLTVFFRIVMPLALPGIAATFIFGFLLAWQDLLLVSALTYSESLQTVTLGIARLIGEFRVRWTMLMAGALVGMIPAIVLYSIMQRHLVKGLSVGAVKE